jgi:hypothetical protein
MQGEQKVEPGTRWRWTEGRFKGAEFIVLKVDPGPEFPPVATVEAADRMMTCGLRVADFPRVAVPVPAQAGDAGLAAAFQRLDSRFVASLSEEDRKWLAERRKGSKGL